MKIKQLFTLALAAGISATSVAETTYSTLISNTAKLTYKVNNVDQVPDEKKADFVVDRKVRFSLSSITALPSAVTVGTPQFILYTLTNDSNADLAFKLSPSDSAPGVTAYTSAVDDTDTSLSISYNLYEDNGSGAPDTSKEILSSDAMTVLQSTDLKVHLRIAPNQANDMNIFAHVLTTTAYETDGATALVDNSADKWVAETVQTVLENNADFRTFTGAVQVTAAEVTLEKTATILSNPEPFDGLAGDQMKAIPGAKVLYSMIVKNTGSEAATAIAVIDILPFEIKDGDIDKTTYKVATTANPTPVTISGVVQGTETIGSDIHIKLTFPEYTIPAGSIADPKTVTISFEVTLP